MRAHRPLASLLVCLGLLSSGTAMSETIQVSVDGKSYPIEMADNADTRTFLARLPMTLTFEITRGTMTVSKPWGNIAIFLVDFPWSSDLADLGQISPEGLEAIRKSGDNPVPFFK